MAAKHFYRQGFLLLLFNFISTAALEKRFSDLKRCADEECSMLLCRGKALTDFSGPDCRFLSFKKSETVYVYYKLAGRRADVWAGSVGSNFGYFPKDLLAVNHLYTEKELEVPAEETDFVCFDTGLDTFQDYDIDSLLGSTLEQISSENNQTSEQIQVAEDTPTETQPPEEDTDSEKQTLSQETEQEADKVPDDEIVSVPERDDVDEQPPLEKVVKSEVTARPDAVETTEELIIPEESVQVVSETSEPKETPSIPQVESVSKDEIVSEQEPVSNSEGAQIPDLKTTLGTTFDAVVTEDEITTKVMPFEEEESHDVDNQSKESVDVKEETPLLSFSEESANTPAPDSSREHETPPLTLEEEPPAKEEKNMWTSIGDAVFSVVTGGELTGIDESSEEDEDEEEEEEGEEKPVAAQTSQDTEGVKQDVEEPFTTESPKEAETVVEEVLQDPSVSDNQEPVSDSGELLTEPEDEGDGEVIGPEDEREGTTEDTPQMQDRESETVLSHEDSEIINEHEEQEVEMFTDSEVTDVNTDVLDSGMVTEEIQGLDNEPEENTTEASQVLIDTETETHQNLSIEEQPANVDVQEDVKPVEESKGDRIDRFFLADIRKNIRQLDSSVVEPPTQEEPPTEEEEEDDHAEPEEEEEVEGKEELLEDENAVSYQPSDNAVEPETEKTPEPVYSDSVMRLTLLRDHFNEEDMDRVQRLLGLNNLFKVEAMFSDLDIELQSTRQSHLGSLQDIESALEGILEASENTILDEIEKMLDGPNAKRDYQQREDTNLDEETEILDDFQELAFSLRQKYSTASDSTPLAVETAEDTHKGESELNVTEGVPYSVEEDKVDFASEVRSEDNITVTNEEEKPPQAEEEPLVVLDEVHTRADVSVEEDSGHFNKNKDNLPGFSTADDMQTFPHATLEKPMDMGLGVEVEPSSSGSFESLDPVSEIHEVKEGLFSTGLVYMGYIFSTTMSKSVEWTTVVISLLPDEWKPGETLYGCPWQAVIVTALVGIMTFTIFFWRTVLSVKSREYLVDAKKLSEQIQALHKEKSDALAKMSELQKQTEKLKESQKQSKESVSSSMKKIQRLESKVAAAESQNEKMIEEKNSYFKLLDEERTHSLKYETRIEKLEKSNEKLQLSRKKIQEELSKTAVLLDEAKIREDARNVLHKSREKEYTALKEENKTLKTTIKGWEDKHKELSEQIKTYQKSQKELEDSVMLKDHNVEVLSELLADLDACDQQKGETKVLANGEIAADKKTFVRNRIKQMMDVSRVQTTLTVVEEERDRFMAKLLKEEKLRKALEEQHEEMNHAVTTIKRDKSHVENQLKVLQQKNEIMVEMYQQKENALQQRLTKEELERRSKESLLTEVGGKAVEAEEQVKVLRQRINEMEDQMKKTEEVYKEQIKEQENKTHSNWLNARNAERALNQEKLEASKLREKLAVLTSQLNERRAPLFRPNSGQPAGPRQADSYGPSPVSGGAPSPPIMIEGPRRPPSAPVGRRIDPYGPRPPSDPHGRYAENKHISGMDMMGPRSSSPANMDGPTQAVDPQVKDEAEAEASTESPEPAPASFIASPIRVSPGPMVPGPPPGPGHHEPLLPPGPHGRLPPPGPYRQPRPGHYHLPPGPPPPNLPPPLHGPPLPPNGHPGMPLPGPMGGEFGPRPANGHAFQPRPGPGIDPRGPPPPHFRPPLPHHYGPMPPPHGVRGPMGPRPPVPQDMRFPGPHMDLPPGVPPHPAHPGDALHNSAGPHSGPGQDLHPRQEAPQDSARPAMVKP